MPDGSEKWEKLEDFSCIANFITFELIQADNTWMSSSPAPVPWGSSG